MKNKIIILINGKERSGVNTIINVLEKRFKIRVIDTMNDIKDIAMELLGYDLYDVENVSELEEDSLYTRAIYNVKEVMTVLKELRDKYSASKNIRSMIDFEIFNYITNKNDSAEILVIKCRYPEEIKTIIKNYRYDCMYAKDINIHSLLIVKSDLHPLNFENVNLPDVRPCDYDFTYYNDKPLEEVESDFIKFFMTNIF